MLRECARGVENLFSNIFQIFFAGCVRGRVREGTWACLASADSMTSLAPPRCAFRASTRQPGPPRPPGRRRRVEKWSGGSARNSIPVDSALRRLGATRACVMGRVREGTNRQESTGIDRSRVCPCGAKHETATAQGRDRVGSGAARRATRCNSVS